jgi:hypothetical protein
MIHALRDITWWALLIATACALFVLLGFQAERLQGSPQASAAYEACFDGNETLYCFSLERSWERIRRLGSGE